MRVRSGVEAKLCKEKCDEAVEVNGSDPQYLGGRQSFVIRETR